MKIYLTRDSVCAGDDLDPPHAYEFNISDDSSLAEVISKIAKQKYLPSISGGKATWSITSVVPIAVIAQEWKKPKMVSFLQPEISELDYSKRILKLNCNYHAQIDPEIVFEVLTRLTMRAK